MKIICFSAEKPCRGEEWVFVLITFPFFEIFLGFSFKHLFSNDLWCIALYAVHVFQGTFLESMHVFQGTFCSVLPLFQGTFGCKDTKFPFSPIITLMQGKPAGNHHGAERDGCGKSQNRKGQDHGALSHGLAYSNSIKIDSCNRLQM